MMRFCSIALLCLGFTNAARANPTQDLLRSVPSDCTLCFVAQDWKGHAQRIAESPFVAQLKKSELGQTLLNPDALQKVFDLEKVLTDGLGFTLDELRDDILGDAILYAYQPGPPGKPDEDSGVLMLKARNPKTLAKLIDSINDAQKKAGELKAVADVKLGKLGYLRREKTDGSNEYYYLREGVFAFTREERLIKQVVALEVAPPKTAPFLEGYNRLGLQKVALAAIFHPRPLDAELKAKLADAKDDNAKAILKQFARIWSATQAAALSVDLASDVELSLHAAFDPKALPLELRPFLGTPKTSALWSAIPKEAMLALAGKLDLPQLMNLGKAFLGDSGLKGLQDLLENKIAPAVGKDTLPELLKSVGPDWGLWLTAPAKTSKGPLPELTVALRVRGADSKDNALGDALRMGLDFAFQTFRVEYNRTHDDQFTLKQIKDDAGAIQHLENAKLLPPGVRPAYAQRGDFLLLASSPEAIQRFDVKKEAPKEDAGLFLRVGWLALEQYLKTHGEDLAKAFASISGKSAADVLKEFRELQQVVELLDMLEVRQTGTVESTKWSMRLKLAAPLKK